MGNNVRFSGINVGTVSEIELVNDSSVVVVLVIQEEVQKYIKTDAMASIGSDGLMGDKVTDYFSRNFIQQNHQRQCFYCFKKSCRNGRFNEKRENQCG